MRTFPTLMLVYAAALPAAAVAQSAPFTQYTGAISAHGAPPSAPASPHSDREQVLPVRSVSLYTNGVAFIELAGKVTGNALVRIDLTTAQLNDALSSLTAWDLGGGKVTGGGYHEAPNGSESLHSLLPALPPNPTQADVLRALKSKSVEVRTGKTVATGRILGVEERADPMLSADPRHPFMSALPRPAFHDVLSLVSDNGSIRTVALSPDSEVRVVGPEGAQLTRALHLVDSTGPAPEMRHLTVEDRGTGTRELHISYLTQAPAWKSTYRALFDGKDATQAKLQGFAVIDNITADDWKNVKLTLVSGAPQSFIQQLSRPLIYSRPTLPLPRPGVPARTSGLVLEALADPLSGAASQSAGHGITQSQAFVPTKSAASGPVGDDETALPTGPATTTDLGDLFEYHLAQPVTLARGQSINVPILETTIAAERVTAWSPHKQNVAPMRALYFANTTGLMLDRGTFTVLIGDAFAGEGQLDLIHPSQQSLVRYATDESIHIEEFRPWKQPEGYIRTFDVRDGELTVHRRSLEERDFKIRNSSGFPATILIQITGQDRWGIEPSAKQPVETIGRLYRFKVEAKPGEETTFRFVQDHSSPKHYKLARLSEDDMKTFLRESNNDPALSALLQPFLDSRKQLAEIDRRLQRNAEAQKSAEMEEARIRSNMSALPQKADSSLSKQYADEMSTQENKLTQLHAEKDDLTAKRHNLEDDITTRAGAALTATTKLRA